MSVIADSLSNQYDDLLHSIRPAVITTAEQCNRYLREISRLMDKGEHNLSHEEQAMLGLLGVLVSEYEQRHSRAERAAPHETVLMLMRTRGLQPKQLWSVFGSKGVTSETLKGKRGISKAKAKALADIFHVSADLFI